jgi:pyruvate formate lyase activating enzyme
VEKVLDLVDLWLVDLKIMDSAVHEQYVGVPNESILENLSSLARLEKKEIIIRIPLIKEINDSAENMDAAADYLKSFETVKYVELLTYHDFGSAKAVSLGLESPEGRFSAPDDDTLFSLAGLLKKYNIPVRWRNELI